MTLDPAVEMTAWWVPREVRVDGDGLWWRGRGRECTIGSNQANLLGQFTRLANAPDEQLRTFAEKWGVLGLCGHGYPATHAATVETAHFDDRVMPLHVCTEPDPVSHAGWQHEPLDRWRLFARQAESMLNIAMALRLRRDPDTELWEPLKELFPIEPIIAGRDVLAPKERRRLVPPGEVPRYGVIGEIRLTIRATAGSSLAQVVERWLELGGVRVRYGWSTDRGHLSFGGSSLFGALSTLLAVGVSGATLLLCDECHLPYAPVKRRPPAGKRHFCPECRDNGAPQRHASADYRARKRQT